MIVEFRIIKKNEPQMIWAHSLNSVHNEKYTLFYGGIQGENFLLTSDFPNMRSAQCGLERGKFIDFLKR